MSLEEVPIDQLRPDPANPRRISEEELDSLERSIRQFGFVQPVLARREDQTVIGGHQRLVAARRLGLATVPVTWLDLSIEQARLLNLALNRISGSWDDALLARLLADLQTTPDVDLSLSGFGEAEIADLLRSLEVREKRERVESFDLDEALAEATRSPRAKPGDLWAIIDSCAVTPQTLSPWQDFSTAQNPGCWRPILPTGSASMVPGAMAYTTPSDRPRRRTCGSMASPTPKTRQRRPVRDVGAGRAIATPR
jgi:hypothetical protein